MGSKKCKKCGLVIANKKNHKRWHKSLKYFSGPPGPPGPMGMTGPKGDSGGI